MSEFKKGIFIGKFYPFHLGHLTTLKILAEKCEEAFLIFYVDMRAEEKLAAEFGVNYSIDQRVHDAEKAVEDIGNVKVKVLTIPPEIIFPKDFLEIKRMVEEKTKGEADVQIFGAEEEATYLPYKYTKAYLLGPKYGVQDEKDEIVSLHATAIRGNYPFYKKYLPVEVRERLG